jgi:hypothetical protein
MNFKNIKVEKSFYNADGGFTSQLEKLDPSSAYAGTDLAGLDAYQRQLKRFDIKTSGAGSDVIAKFFNTSESAALFPEFVGRAVAQGTKDAGILDEILAAKTEINSLDYRSIVTDVSDTDFSAAIAEGTEIPETNIALSGSLVALKKRGRILKSTYEAIRFQRADVVSVALKQIGAYIAKAQLADAVNVLINGVGSGETPDIPAAVQINTAGSELTYDDLLTLWNAFDNFEMNVMLASPDMVLAMLKLAELRDPMTGLNFIGTGGLSTPLGAKLIRSSAVPAGTIIGLDKNYALEMVSTGAVSVEYDKLIDAQLERAAVTVTSGFGKIFPDAVKVLKLAVG